jgi:formylglycine-generating enzyme required for sulfatase activity
LKQKIHVRETAPERMVMISGGKFLMGSEKFYPEERPVRQVEVSGFYMDIFAVTNEEYNKFVSKTGYVTVAERPLNPADYPEANPSLLAPGALVFRKSKGPARQQNYYDWWEWIRGANWKHPRGPASSLAGKWRHPVVHIAYEDAEAYAKWVGKDLPTEAEWEFAARGGLEGKNFTWGDEDVQLTKPLANTWQGEFPHQNLLIDGYEGTSPVGSFPPNGYGLYDMAGNVWEWTSDWYLHVIDGSTEKFKTCCTTANPRVVSQEASYDPCQPNVRIPRKVIKGGSHLCAPNYCLRYRPAARQPQMIDTGMAHLGFRCIKRMVNTEVSF